VGVKKGKRKEDQPAADEGTANKTTTTSQENPTNRWGKVVVPPGDRD
jgi:hypothetical protein